MGCDLLDFIASRTLCINRRAVFSVMPYRLPICRADRLLVVMDISKQMKKAFLTPNFTLWNSVPAVELSVCEHLLQTGVVFPLLIGGVTAFGTGKTFFPLDFRKVVLAIGVGLEPFGKL